LTQLGLQLSDFRKIGENVKEMAEICGGKVIDLIASGYNEKFLPYGFSALISGLAGLKIKIDDPELRPTFFLKKRVEGETKEMVGSLRKELKKYWGKL